MREKSPFSSWCDLTILLKRKKRKTRVISPLVVGSNPTLGIRLSFIKGRRLRKAEHSFEGICVSPKMAKEKHSQGKVLLL